MYSQQVKLVYSPELYMKMKLSGGSLPHTVHLWRLKGNMRIQRIRLTVIIHCQHNVLPLSNQVL